MLGNYYTCRQGQWEAKLANTVDIPLTSMYSTGVAFEISGTFSYFFKEYLCPLCHP